MGLIKVEEIFNEFCEFDKLIEEATKYIQRTLVESDINFLSEDITDDEGSFKQLKTEYNRTHLFLNEKGRRPYFRLQFYLYEYNCVIPKYIYEIEYNSEGKFSDEFFLRYE